MVRVMRALEHIKQRPRFCQVSLLTMTTTIGTICKHAFNEAIECEGQWENEERKKKRKKEGGGKKESTGKGEEVLTEGIGLFLYSLALQGWFIDKVMVPWYVIKFNVLRT